MKVQSRTWGEGDRLRLVRAFLYNADGTPLVAGGADTIAFRMIRQDTDAVKVNDQAAVWVTRGSAGPPATPAEVTYAFTAGDVDTPARYWAWFIRTAGGLKDHHPPDRTFEIVITETG